MKKIQTQYDKLMLEKTKQQNDKSALLLKKTEISNEYKETLDQIKLFQEKLKSLEQTIKSINHAIIQCNNSNINWEIKSINNLLNWDKFRHFYQHQYSPRFDNYYLRPLPSYLSNMYFKLDLKTIDKIRDYCIQLDNCQIKFFYDHKIVHFFILPKHKTEYKLIFSSIEKICNGKDNIEIFFQKSQETNQNSNIIVINLHKSTNCHHIYMKIYKTCLVKIKKFLYWWLSKYFSPKLLQYIFKEYIAITFKNFIKYMELQIGSSILGKYVL